MVGVGKLKRREMHRNRAVEEEKMLTGVIDVLSVVFAVQYLSSEVVAA